jgi:hypothetical protein
MSRRRADKEWRKAQLRALKAATAITLAMAAACALYFTT